MDPAELEMVIASVHSLLVILLSDHTLGLVYKDLSLGTKAQRNYLIAHVFRVRNFSYISMFLAKYEDIWRVQRMTIFGECVV